MKDGTIYWVKAIDEDYDIRGHKKSGDEAGIGDKTMDNIFTHLNIDHIEVEFLDFSTLNKLYSYIDKKFNAEKPTKEKYDYGIIMTHGGEGFYSFDEIPPEKLARLITTEMIVGVSDRWLANYLKKGKEAKIHGLDYERFYGKPSKPEDLDEVFTPYAMSGSHRRKVETRTAILRPKIKKKLTPKVIKKAVEAPPSKKGKKKEREIEEKIIKAVEKA